MRRHILAIILAGNFLAGCRSGIPVGEWRWTGGPHAQNIAAVHISLESPQEWTAALTTGEVFRSLDTGRTWSSLSVIDAGASAYRFIAHPHDPSILYTTTSHGLFRSTNRGVAWERIPLGVTGSSIFLLAFDPFNPQVLYAGSSGSGIWKSTNGGTGWNRINAGVPDSVIRNAEVHDIIVLLSRPDVLFAAISGYGVVSSDNRGEEWRLITSEALPQSKEVIALFATNKDGTILAGTSGGNILRTSNAGSTWSATRSGYLGGSITTLAHGVDGSSVLAGSERGVLVSSDNGLVWQRLSLDLPIFPARVTTLPFLDRNVVIAYGEGLGLSANINTMWERRDVGLGGSSVFVVQTDKFGRRLLCGTGGSVHRFDRTASQWVSVCDGLTGAKVNVLATLIDSSSNLFAGTDDGIYVSSGRGREWKSISRTLRAIPIRFLETHPAIRTRMYTSGTAGLWISTNTGKNWAQVYPQRSEFRVRSMTFSPTNAALMYAATSNESCIKSTDGGFTWETARYGIADNDMLAIGLSPAEKNTLFAWGSSGAGFRSTNGGLQWHPYAPPWHVGSKVLIATDKWDPSIVIALAEKLKLYFSRNGGATWLTLSVPPLGSEPLTLHINSNSRTAYLGTRLDGVYSISLAEEVLEELSKE